MDRTPHHVHGYWRRHSASLFRWLHIYLSDASINRATAEYELTETRMGFVAIINDLHEGRDTGAAWSWVIDLSAVLMIVVSLTGTVWIFFFKRPRFAGLVAAVLGGLLSYLVYRLWVP